MCGGSLTTTPQVEELTSSTATDTTEETIREVASLYRSSHYSACHFQKCVGSIFCCMQRRPPPPTTVNIAFFLGGLSNGESYFDRV